ncbi:Peptidase m61 domain-containing protein [Pleurostoma richardsiae]|uniref:Peptidase m61 domain-containing protein n=1 Tax=Pleurostoma richardsiae TaxID=41990 RepID=A0AA38R3L0_9PEZI|nr:Peptidase m61 domain-containing protein [Pleurostoma richardsiae]
MVFIAALLTAVSGLAPLIPASAMMIDPQATFSALPSLNLTLTPFYSVPNPVLTTVPSGINVTMHLRPGADRLAANLPLLSLVLKRGLTPFPRYDPPSGIIAHDAAGPLPLSISDADPELGPRTWSPARDPVGEEIVVTFSAPARVTDERTLPGPRIDLRRDAGGGLVGQGGGFIPSPPPPRRNGGGGGGSEPGSGVHDPWDVSVAWDLAGAPLGTRAAWSLGDGGSGKGAVVSAVGSPEQLVEHGIFAVGGTLQRYPLWDENTSSSSALGAAGGAEREFAMYWLGEPAWDMPALARATEDMFVSVADYFSSPDPFRVFFRQVESGNGGTGATQSFLLEYSPGTPEEMDAHGMADLLAHEAVHEYALMEPADDGAQWSEQYDEGVASYIGALVGLSRADMIRSLNGYAQAYYTSPAVNMSFRYVLDHYWDSLHITRVSYFRGFMYLAQVNGMILEATRGKHSLDDIIQELYRLRVAHKPCQTKEFMSMIAGYVGEDVAKASYDKMWNGELVVPPVNTFAKYGLKLIRKDLERFDLGFDPNSMRTHKVQGLVKGSNAEKAGVREGDEIVKGFMAWGVADEYDNRMKIVVKRGDAEKSIVWRPRSSEKVESWMWIDIEEEDVDEL